MYFQSAANILSLLFAFYMFIFFQKSFLIGFLKDFIYLFFERGEGTQKEREGYNDAKEKHHRLPLVGAPTGD